MFFRKSQSDGGKRKAKPQQKSSKPKVAQQRKKAQRRLDSVTLQIQPQTHVRWSPPSPQRGAPLSPATQWLLDQMSRFSDIDNYAVFKESFIAIYLSDPNHHPGSAERAFYSAVQICKRRLGGAGRG